MKNSGECHKCDSREIYLIKGFSFNMYQQIPLNKWNTTNATLDRYICSNCGYTEEFVQLNEKFHKWAKKSVGKMTDGDDDNYV